jgi:protease I
MKLRGKKVALFVADSHDDRQFWYPYYRMHEEGAEVVVIGPAAEPCRGQNGTTVVPDQCIDEAQVQDFDALVVPGGAAAARMRREDAMLAFAGELHRQGGVVAAIQQGTGVLAEAGLAADRRVTSLEETRGRLRDAGGRWVNQEVVSDSDVITSRRPDDLPAFCRAIIDSLSC